jgi:hypothetical protein
MESCYLHDSTLSTVNIAVTQFFARSVAFATSCVSLMVSHRQQWSDFRESWFEQPAAGGHHSFVLFNIPASSLL